MFVLQPGSSSGDGTLDMCYFNHLTTFTSVLADVVVPVNTIDFGNVFSTDLSLQSSIVMIVIIIGLLIYMISVIWMRKKDKQDILNVRT